MNKFRSELMNRESNFFETTSRWEFTSFSFLFRCVYETFLLFIWLEFIFGKNFLFFFWFFFPFFAGIFSRSHFSPISRTCERDKWVFICEKEWDGEMPNGVERNISLKCQLFERDLVLMAYTRPWPISRHFIRFFNESPFLVLNDEDLENAKYGQVLEALKAKQFFMFNGFAMKVALVFSVFMDWIYDVFGALVAVDKPLDFGWNFTSPFLRVNESWR